LARWVGLSNSYTQGKNSCPKEIRLEEILHKKNENNASSYIIIPSPPGINGDHILKLDTYGIKTQKKLRNSLFYSNLGLHLSHLFHFTNRSIDYFFTLYHFLVICTFTIIVDLFMWTPHCGVVLIYIYVLFF
jgi:hypothetical protein